MTSIIKKSDVVSVSVGSFAFCMFGTLTLLLGAIITKVRGGQLVSVLLGNDASVSLVQASQDSVLTRVGQALSNDTLGRTVVFMSWTFAGLMVYALISATRGATRQLRDINTQMHMIHQDRASFSRTLWREMAFRFGVSLAWVIYTLFCLHLLLPFFFAAIAIVFGGGAQTLDWLMLLAATAIIFLSLHGHVILARMFFGRVRLFSV